jgi:hypothetical protein
MFFFPRQVKTPFLILISLAFLSMLACGKKGNPRAPELTVPEAITNLKAKAEKDGIVLTWSRPLNYVDGKTLEDLAGFLVFRKDISGVCPQCPVPYRERMTISIEDGGRLFKKRKFLAVDKDISPQMTYRYRVFSRLTDGSLSDPSNEASVASMP